MHDAVQAAIHSHTHQLFQYSLMEHLGIHGDRIDQIDTIA